MFIKFSKTKSLFVICCFFAFHLSAQKVQIFGKITDTETGETLIGANVFDSKSKNGAAANEYGFYSLSVLRGELDLEISYVGYAKKLLKINVLRDTNIDITLSASVELATVEITERKNDRIEHGVVSLPIQKLKSIPMLGGEPDVLKALAMTPGVATGAEGSNALHIRGGTPDQNLVLLDGATVYNVSHLFGFMSTFNPYALKNLTLYKGGFPARYGGRLSSVIDVTMKEGNTKKTDGDFTLGLVNAGLNLEGPIKKLSGSYMLSGRTAYLGLFSMFQKRYFEQGKTNNANDLLMYDLNGKLNFKLSSKSQLYLSSYGSADDFSNRNRGGNSITETNLAWGNRTATVRYAYNPNKKTFVNAMLNYNQFTYSTDIKNYLDKATNKEPLSVQNISSVRDYSHKLNIDYAANTHNQVRIGWELNNHAFRPNFITKITDTDTTNINENVRQKANSYAAYAEDNITFNNLLSANIGVRWVQYFYNTKAYNSLEPRASIQAKFTEGGVVQASFSKMKQFTHLLSTSTSLLSNDIWVPATNIVPPQSATQYALSYTKNWKKIKTELQVEAFYKQMDNQIDYRSGANFFFSSTTNWEQVIEKNGIGRAYGLEFFLRKESERWNGWISYTLSKSERRFDNINNGTWYPMRYDRRHNLSIVGEYKINDEWSAAANFVFMTGHALTVPEAFYKPMGSLTAEPIYTKKNNQRTPMYNRCDVSMKKTYLTNNNREAAWIFSVYNIFAYPNAFAMEYADGAVFNSTTRQFTSYNGQMSRRSILRFIPSVSYTLNLSRAK